MTSLCGVSPILHRIKNREPEEHTDVGPGFAIPVQAHAMRQTPYFHFYFTPYASQ